MELLFVCPIHMNIVAKIEKNGCPSQLGQFMGVMYNKLDAVPKKVQ